MGIRHNLDTGSKNRIKVPDYLYTPCHTMCVYMWLLMGCMWCIWRSTCPVPVCIILHVHVYSVPLELIRNTYMYTQVREIREVIKSTKQQLEEIQSQFSPINRPSLVVEVIMLLLLLFMPTCSYSTNSMYNVHVHVAGLDLPL